MREIPVKSVIGIVRSNHKDQSLFIRLIWLLELYYVFLKSRYHQEASHFLRDTWRKEAVHHIQDYMVWLRAFIEFTSGWGGTDP